MLVDSSADIWAKDGPHAQRIEGIQVDSALNERSRH
jgi:hypothetical protein